MTQDNNQLDKSTYESAREYLKAALEQTLAAGRSARDFTEFTLEKFGDAFLPYMHEFSKDVGKGRIKIEGMAESARTVIIGHHVTEAQREAMIREAAYLRAEQRGFVGGSAEDDWFIATHEVDAQLAREAGLVEKGRKVLTSATTIVEKELGNVKHVVTDWLESRHGKAETKKTAGKKKAAKKAVEAAIEAAAEKAVTKKKAAKKKAATKKKAEAAPKSAKEADKSKKAAKKKAAKNSASSSAAAVSASDSGA